MKMTIGQVIFAIGFKHEDPLFTVHYTVATLERPARRHYYALTVVEERETKCEHTGKPVETKGYILEDQHGTKWNYHWPTVDSSGRGLIFERNTENMTPEQIKHIFENEVCECRDICGFFSTLIMETEDLRQPPKHKVVENETSVAIQQRRDRLHWMEQHKSNVVQDIKNHLFVDVEFTPHTDTSGKVLDSRRFVKAILKDVDFTAGAVKALSFMALFGDMANWPDIFLGHVDFSFACHCYYDVFHKFPTNTAQLRDPKVRAQMQLMKTNMRAHLQSLLDELGAESSTKKSFTVEPRSPVYANSIHRTDAADTFRDMNKPSEHGTIAEICAKYNISKSEARRRKAEGTLHELASS